MVANNTHNYFAKLKALAKKRRVRIAIGIDKVSPDIVRSINRAKAFADITVVGTKVPGVKNIPLVEPQEIADTLLALLDNHDVDALVRGQIHPRFLFLPVFRRLGMELSYLNGIGQHTVAVFENAKTKRFFALGSVELTQGYDLQQKKSEALAIVHFLKEYGYTPYVGIMAMRRGRPKNAKPLPGFKPNPIIDQTYRYSELLLAFLRRHRIKADLFNIEYETAVDAGVNIIIPPLGAIGNAFARSLIFFSDKWEVISNVPLHFRPLVIQHSFKTGKGRLFYNMIIAAAAEAVKRRYHKKK